MKASWLLQFTLATSTAVACTLCAGVGAALATPDAAPPRDDGDSAENSLTGIWRGTFVTQHDVASDGYLDITEHADGSLSGKWGNDPRGALTIEHGECVTKDIFQWEAPSQANEKGRYRVRATLSGKTLQLDVTYTWREKGKVKGLTAVSTLTRK